MNTTDIKLDNSDFNFKNGNPGAVRYGNFVNYYSFHSPQSRLEMLPVHIWSTCKKNLNVLDIGCNSGNLTYLLHEFLENYSLKYCNMLGIDIDPVLIERAEERKPSNKFKFICLDFMSDKTSVLSYLDENKTDKFDVIFCFSITMWIHLNHGDEGVIRFLCDVLNLGKIIVIEPQPWKCYRSAVKRLKNSSTKFPFYSKIKIKDIEKELEKMVNSVFKEQVSQIYKSELTEWGRKVLIFRWND